MPIPRHFLQYLLLGLSVFGKATAQYQLTTISPPASIESWASSIDDLGLVQGGLATSDNPNYHPFLWQNGQFYSLDLPGWGIITDLSPTGVIIGTYQDSSARSRPFSFLFRNQNLTPLGPAGTPDGQAVAELPNGVFAGTYSPTPEGNTTHVFVSSPGGFFDLTPDVSFATIILTTTSGYLFGTSFAVNTPSRAFTWRDGAVTDLLPAGSSGIQVTGSNTRTGQVFGRFYVPGSSPREVGFVWQEGIFQELSVPGAKRTSIGSSNEAGTIIGFFTDSENRDRACLWIDGVLTDISAKIPNAKTSLTQRIDAAGRVLGTFYDGAEQSGYKAFLWENGAFIPLVPGGAGSSYAFFNAEGAIQGSYQNDSGDHAFVWTEGALASMSPPGAQSSQITSTASDGRYLGTYIDGSNQQHAFVWQAGEFTDFYFSGGRNYAIREAFPGGFLFGSYQDTANNVRTFIWKDGQRSEVKIPGAESVTISKQTTTGYLTGSYRDVTGNWHAFIWHDGVITDLARPGESHSEINFINSRGDVVGFTAPDAHSNQWLGFVRKDGVFFDLSLPTNPYLFIDSFSDSGEVIGHYYAATALRNFIWSNGEFLAVSGSTALEILGTNIGGQSVGRFLDSQQNPHAFVRRDGVLVDLETFLPAGVSSSTAASINSAGDIVGQYRDKDQIGRAFLLRPDGIVPTPTPAPPATPLPTPTTTPIVTSFPTATPHAPSPSNAQPQLAITRRPPRITTRSFATLRGVANGRVSYRLAGQPWHRLARRNPWKIRIALRPGKNLVTIVVRNASGGITRENLRISRTGS